MFKKPKKISKNMQCSYGVTISHLYWKKNTTLPQKPQKMCLINQYIINSVIKTAIS